MLFQEKALGQVNNSNTGKKDSFVVFAKKYMHSADSIASRGGRRIKVFAKTGNSGKFVPVQDDHWPDSMTMACYVVYYNDRPLEYIEIPVSGSEDIYREYDNYFYKGRIIGFKIAKSIFKGSCTERFGAMNERITTYFDSTGLELKTEQVLLDSKNKPVKEKICQQTPDKDAIIYKTFSDLPLVRAKKIPDYRHK